MLRATKSGRASVKKCVCVPVPAEGEQKEAGGGRGSPPPQSVPPSLVWPGWACCCSPQRALKFIVRSWRPKPSRALRSLLRFPITTAIIPQHARPPAPRKNEPVVPPHLALHDAAFHLRASSHRRRALHELEERETKAKRWNSDSCDKDSKSGQDPAGIAVVGCSWSGFQFSTTNHRISWPPATAIGPPIDTVAWETS